MPSVYRIGDPTLDAGRQQLRRDADSIQRAQLNETPLWSLMHRALLALDRVEEARSVFEQALEIRRSAGAPLVATF